MKKLLKVLLLIAFFAQLSLSAHAQVYNLAGNLSYVSGENLGAGSFDLTFTTAVGDIADIDGAAVIGISGTFFGSPITGLSSYANANNRLYDGGNPYFDFNGISFLLNPPLGQVWSLYDLDVINIFYDGTETLTSIGCSSCDNRFSMYRVSTVTTQVPEPETYAMFMAGLGLLGFASRKKKLG